MNLRIFFPFAGCLLSWALSYSQVNEDFQVWTGIDVDHEIAKDLDAEIGLQTRFQNNSTTLDEGFVNLSLSYKFNKRLDFSGGYRLSQKRDDFGFLRTGHRLDLNMDLDYKGDPFSFYYRARYQTSFKDIQSSEDGFIPSNYWRNRFQLKIDLDDKLKDFTPYVNTEIYYQLNNPAGNQFDKIRYVAGLEIDMGERQELEVFYMIERELNQSFPERNYILGIGYAIGIK